MFLSCVKLYNGKAFWGNSAAPIIPHNTGRKAVKTVLQNKTEKEKKKKPRLTDLTCNILLTCLNSKKPHGAVRQIVGKKV